jgi:hypothetical protein
VESRAARVTTESPKNQAYPRFGKAAKVGAAAGFASAVLTMMACAWIASEDPVTPVSLCLSFRPWWRASNWLLACLAFAVAALIFFTVVAYRPVGPPVQPRRSLKAGPRS